MRLYRSCKLRNSTLQSTVQDNVDDDVDVGDVNLAVAVDVGGTVRSIGQDNVDNAVDVGNVSSETSLTFTRPSPFTSPAMSV